MKTLEIRRGDVYLVDLGTDSQGTKLRRPVLVIQNDIGNKFCSTIIVVPLTPAYKVKRLLFGVLMQRGGSTGLPSDHVALFSQIRTLGKDRFRVENFLGRADDRIIVQVDRAIQLSLGLSTLQQLQTRSIASRRRTS